jgi:hypothetical protein
MLAALILSVPLSGVPLHAQSRQLPAQEVAGSISGTILDASRSAIGGARVKLTRDAPSTSEEALSSDDGQFSFARIAPGPFHLAIVAHGFATQVFSGILHPEENYIVPVFELAISAETTNMQVVSSQVEVAEEQIKEQEKQRVLGVVPNFYVSYIPNAAPLNSKQKFELAWRTAVDPVTIVMTGGIAGAQQASNGFSGYGQGAQGYGKRFGADYADMVSGTFIGSAILPSLLKQDPRYFYKGTGSRPSRFLYALANSFICKGDNGRWQANYSNVLGSIAAGGISNLYYPTTGNNRVGLTFGNAAIGIGVTAVMNLFQEFVVRKMTPNVHSHDPATP